MSSLGILDDTKLEHVPGTSLLDDYSSHASDNAHAKLKHGSGKYSHIVLTPQPSDDPNDPLNWPLWRKDLALATVSFGCILYTAVCIPVLTPATYELSILFNKPITDITKLTGFMMLVIALWGLVVGMLARTFGKRPVFLLSSVFGLIGTVVCECSNTYETLLAGRIIQGLACPVFESLIVNITGELYFVHERGSRVTAMQFSGYCMGALSPVVAGAIYSALGWRYLFHILTPLVALQAIMTFLFVPETVYFRSEILETDTGTTDHYKELAEKEKSVEKAVEIETYIPDALPSTHSSSFSVSTPDEKTFWQRTKVYNGRFSKTNPGLLFVAPFVTLANPAAVWITVTQGISTAWLMTTSFVISQIWSAPPYNLSAASVGKLSVGPTIGSFIACAILVFGSDPIAIFCARKNKGLYEPEFRIFPIVLAFITGAIGLFCMGNLTEEGKGYYVFSTMYGFYGVSIILGSGVANAYMVDAFRTESVEIAILGMLFKNIMGFQCSYWVNDYLAKVGPARFFDMEGGVLVGVFALSIPMYVLGKRNRGWWARFGGLERFGIRQH